ncbi:hypothetical protein D1831_12995 [Lactiplantibacillus garii]|uniref:DUF6287 domain-containing protein n=1 Tax=Lactiplantibacillus garii TaxID=2306423 RepID=A0A426D4Q5_9LACO|nr:DUF6287 domain-containing protein [Lactiplantibacillus garii]RRK09389.1 hypothetical protein D1831_12995 [Lactiplantibacillus garii]
MKKITLMSTSLLLLLALSACGKTQNQAKSASKSSATHERIGKTTTKTNKAASRSTATATSQTTTKTSGTAMNLAQIKRGDYSGLASHWHQVAMTYNRQDGKGVHYKTGGDKHLSVSKSTITDGNVTLRGDQFTDDGGDTHSVNFKGDHGSLVTLLDDSDKVGVNWAVTFYPKGSTDKIKLNSDTKKNTQDLITIWDSGSQYTAIFAPSTAKTTTKRLNLAQLADNNFSSLVGRWKNPAGKVLTVTNRVAKRPKSSQLALAAGAVIQEKSSDGKQQVIGAGKVTNGMIQGSFGSFSNMTMEPLLIVPAGVKAEKGDDSNVKKDRLIMGGGQGGYASEAYYRD